MASGEKDKQVRFGEAETLNELADALTLLGNLTRLRIIAALSERPMFVQELSTRLNVSYPLLHLHLKNMEKHGLVRSEYRVGTDKTKRYVKRYFELVDFRIEVTPMKITRLARTGGEGPKPSDEEEVKRE